MSEELPFGLISTKWGVIPEGYELREVHFSPNGRRVLVIVEKRGGFEKKLFLEYVDE